MSRLIPVLCIAGALLAGLASPAHAESISLGGNLNTFEFARVSNNADVDAASLFSLDVQDATLGDSNLVVFTFRNEALSDPSDPLACTTITDVYWGGTADLLFDTTEPVVFLPSTSTPGSSAGVSFSGAATPASPADVPWDADGADFSSDGDPPPAHTGIDRGEHGTFYLVLDSDYTYASVITHIGSMDLGIALHAQCLPNGLGEDEDSDFFHVVPVPEPTSMALMGLGLAGLAAVRRRRRD